jgi:hypothetical protein
MMDYDLFFAAARASAMRARTSRFTSASGSGFDNGNCTVPVDVL